MAEVERLKQALEISQARVAALEAVHPTLEKLAMVATGKSQVSNAWKIAQCLSKYNSCTEAELAEHTGLTQGDIQRGCVYLQRHKCVVREGDNWRPAGGTSVSIVSDEDMAGLVYQASQFLLEHVIPIHLSAKGKGSLVMAEVKVSGEMPGRQILTAMRQALVAVEHTDGVPVRVLIGLAPSSNV